MSTPMLYDWGPSPFCLKVRAIFDYKGVEYGRTRVDPMKIAGLMRRGGTGKVPALDLDGTLVSDSTEIALAVESRWAEPSILPDDPRVRAQCMVLEDWADEALYWLGIYFQWIDPEGLAKVPLAFGRSLPQRLVAKVYERLIRRQLRGQGTGRKPRAQVLGDLERALDAIEALVGEGTWLLGDGPYLCDFAVASQVVYVARTPVGGPLVAARPGLGRLTEGLKAVRGKA